jgi:hypothetical protein
VASFDDGLITHAPVNEGDGFLRYTDVADSKGSFLTNQLFSSPSDAVDALALGDYGNNATLVQNVTANYGTMVLQGGIRGGAAGVQQTLIIDRGAFSFSTGAPY